MLREFVCLYGMNLVQVQIVKVFGQSSFLHLTLTLHVSVSGKDASDLRNE